jgi:hypothetical protein
MTAGLGEGPGSCTVKTSRSADGGKSWSPFVQASASDAGANNGQPVFSRGEVLIPSIYGDANFLTAGIVLLRSADKGVTWAVDEVRPRVPAEERQPVFGGFVSVAVAADGTEAVGWYEDARILVSIREAGGPWSKPVPWSREGEEARVGPALLPTADGWALSYITHIGPETEGFLDFHLAFGDDRGPTRWIDLGKGRTSYGYSANSDFATLDRLPDGRFVVTENLAPPDGMMALVDFVDVGPA